MKNKKISKKKKPNILQLIVLSFFGFGLFVVLLIMTIVYVKRDEIHCGERIVEQLRNNEYLKKNIDNYYYLDYEIIDELKTKDQIYDVMQLTIGGGPRYVIVDVWYKNEKYDWQFDSVKIVRQPGKYARMKEQSKYKFKNRIKYQY